jgi:hypothetical protein
VLCTAVPSPVPGGLRKRDPGQTGPPASRGPEGVACGRSNITMQMVTRHRTIRAVSGRQHFRTIYADRHFSARGMPKGASVAYSVCGPNGIISGGTFRVLSSCLSGAGVRGRRHRRPILERAGARLLRLKDSWRSRPHGHAARICGRHAAPRMLRNARHGTGRARHRHRPIAVDWPFASRPAVASLKRPPWLPALSGQRRERAGRPPRSVGEAIGKFDSEGHACDGQAVRTESLLAPMRHLFELMSDEDSTGSRLCHTNRNFGICRVFLGDHDGGFPTDGSRNTPPRPNLAPLSVHSNAVGIADLDPDRTSTGSIGAHL